MEKGLRVVPHAAPIAVDDRLECRNAVLDGEQLVDLLLVLGDGEADLGMVEDERHLVGAGILIDRHRDAAERLGRGNRPIEARPIVADNRQLVAAAEAHGGKAVGERGDLVGHLAPAPALPDAVILLAVCRLVAAPCRMIEQQLGEGIERNRARGACRAVRRQAIHARTPGVYARKSPSVPPRRFMSFCLGIYAPIAHLPNRKGKSRSSKVLDAAGRGGLDPPGEGKKYDEAGSASADAAVPAASGLSVFARRQGRRAGFHRRAGGVGQEWQAGWYR